ncbi:hypothetical protein Droror1_Dr00022477 [Drosera rotundifolia]
MGTTIIQFLGILVLMITRFLDSPLAVVADDTCLYPCLPPPTDVATGEGLYTPPPAPETPAAGELYPPPATNFPYYPPTGNSGTAVPSPPPPPPDAILPYFPYFYRNGPLGSLDQSSWASVPTHWPTGLVLMACCLLVLVL